MKNVELSLLPNLTRSKLMTVNFGTTTPTINQKYFFDYDLEVKDSKTVGIYLNQSTNATLNKINGLTPVTPVDCLKSLYVTLVDKDNNNVVENMPLNALARIFYSQGSFRPNTFFPESKVIRKFDVEIDWARSYVVFYDTPGTLTGTVVPFTVYYKRKIQ